MADRTFRLGDWQIIAGGTPETRHEVAARNVLPLIAGTLVWLMQRLFEFGALTVEHPWTTRLRTPQQIITVTVSARMREDSDCDT